MLHELFTLHDHNGNGWISLEETQRTDAAFCAEFGLPFDVDEVAAHAASCFQNADTKRDGMMDVDEFVAYHTKMLFGTLKDEATIISTLRMVYYHSCLTLLTIH